MALRKYWWVLIPLAAGFGCAGSQQEQKVAKAGGKSTLQDEGPASATAQGAAEQSAAAGGAAGAAGVAAAGQPGQLVPFHGANGFTVLMPPNPEKNERTQDTPGGPVQVHIASAQDASGKYLSSLSEFPKGSLDKVKSKDLLDSLQQATVQSMGGTLVKSQDVQVGGLPGREFTATDPQGSEVTARVFVGDSRVYTLAGTYPKGGAIPGSIQQFLGSFQPPAGTAVGGSGPADSAAASSGSASGMSNTGSTVDTPTAGDSMNAGSDLSATQPSSKSKKKSSRSSSSGSIDSSSAGSGSR